MLAAYWEVLGSWSGSALLWTGAQQQGEDGEDAYDILSLHPFKETNR